MEAAWVSSKIEFGRIRAWQGNLDGRPAQRDQDSQALLLCFECAPC